MDNQNLDIKAVRALYATTEKLSKNMDVLQQSVEMFTDEMRMARQARSSDPSGIEEIALRQNENGPENRYRRVKYMSGCEIKPDGFCSCGKMHIGITFTDKAGNVVAEKQCPQWWWVMRNWIAFREKDKRWVDKNPIDEWMKQYTW